MRLGTAHCTQIESIGHGRIRGLLETAIVPAPGQFALARLVPTHDPYLQTAVFPVQYRTDGFLLELAPGDPARPFLTPGATIPLLGPLGQRISAGSHGANLLLVADVNPAPLLPLAMQVLAQGGAVTLLLGRPYPVEALDPEIEVRLGPLAELVGEHVDWARQVCLHVEQGLSPELAAALVLRSSTTAVLFARPMPCGVGACQACAVRTGRGWRLACTTGPFIPLEELPPPTS